MADIKDTDNIHGIKTEKEIKKSRSRSPNYPVVGFPNALERAREFYNEYGKTTVPIVVAHEVWNYKLYSAYLKQIVAALKSFGLLDVVGVADKRELTITNEALRILDDAPDKQKIINELVLKPQIYGELWEKYKDEGIPSDSILKTHLQWGGNNFNKKVVDSFINDFKESMALVKFESDDIMDEQNDQGEEDMGNEGFANPPANEEPSHKKSKDFIVIDSIIGSLKVRYPMNEEKLEVITKFLAAEKAEHNLEADNTTESDNTKKSD